MNDKTGPKPRQTPRDSPLRRARLAAGWRQLDLAEKASVSRETIRLLESGRHAPKVLTATAIARALGDPDLHGLDYAERMTELFPELEHVRPTLVPVGSKDGSTEALAVREAEALEEIARFMRACAASLGVRSEIGRALAHQATQLGLRAAELAERDVGPRKAGA